MWFSRRRLAAIAGGILIIAFSSPLWELVKRSLQEELLSHILLIPFVSAYLIWIRRKEFLPALNRDFPLATITAGAGLSVLIGYFIASGFGGRLSDNDRLSLLMFSFVCLVGALFLAVSGRDNVHITMFPLGLLLLMVPFPAIVLNGITAFLQLASAEAAYFLIKLSGTPILRNDLVFTLPGLPPIEVAAECSGIRSTLVLFITGLVGGQLFLQRPSAKWVLAVATILIGIARNGFRILSLVLLSIHVDPSIMDGPVHSQGGPIFFLISLVPLLGLLMLLRRREQRSRSQGT